MELDDGHKIAAPVVASSLGVSQTMRQLIGINSATPELRDIVRAAELANRDVVGSYAAVLESAPRYLSARHNTDIDRCAQTFVGADSTEEVVERRAALRAGQLPSPGGAMRINSLFDPTQAPDGRHVAGGDCAFPTGLDEEWQSMVRSTFPDALATVWAQYAPNISDAVAAHTLSLDATVSRSVVVREGSDQYRGPIPGLYVCGSSTHPGGGVHGACGSNAARTIIGDQNPVGVK